MLGRTVTQTSGNPRQAAMTAIELLILVAAVGLLVLISVPGSSMLIERYRVNAVSTDLARGLSLARSEAIKRGSTVRLCPSANGRVCSTDGDWSQGWLVYSDGNADGTVQEFELIEVFARPAGEIRIIAAGPVERDASFDLAGLVGDTDKKGEHRGGEFLVCYPGSSADAKAVVIDDEGWVNVVPSGAGGCATGTG